MLPFHPSGRKTTETENKLWNKYTLRDHVNFVPYTAPRLHFSAYTASTLQCFSVPNLGAIIFFFFSEIFSQ